ncbi:transcription antitermination factor NusB [Geobacter sp. SVR]|uniref:transcription antitermination factor NusB n=1 Tax=Geobacter sp. SVR TaxID=2495594 RepID=UPI00143EFDE8|nr:transcription antitermination factor NusB [Geobacter sp. SVR]BCS52968.1 N utilization substance protein B [Geobacter sp. SVR]GCF84352.1 N utilization substance protein B [Geobacter sp. SVR]
MGLRREARELALQMLYALDANPTASLRETLQSFREDQPEVAARVREFAEGLVHGVRQWRPEIDAAISARSKNWSLARMPRVDLNVMRLAAYELMYRPDIPKKVTINEAIEIARKFGDKDSPAFVNGILDDIEPCPKTEETNEE